MLKTEKILELIRTNLIANGLANGVGLKIEQLPVMRGVGIKGGKFYKKKHKDQLEFDFE